MRSSLFIEPDLDFVAQINSDAGPNRKKGYQCATCLVACTIAHDNKLFPRKEMIYASWGLKDRLIANPDIWLCCNCKDCSALCPRDARPGDVLNTLGKMSIQEYSKPAAMHRLFNDYRKLPWLFIIPALIFIPLSLGVTLVFFWGVRRFLADMQAAATGLGKAATGPIDLKRFLTTQLPAIIKHERFSECSENKGRKISHMMVSFSWESPACSPRCSGWQISPGQPIPCMLSIWSLHLTWWLFCLTPSWLTWFAPPWQLPIIIMQKRKNDCKNFEPICSHQQ